MKDEKHKNKGQFLVLLLLCLIIFADKLPVIYDKLNHFESYRIHDGFRDSLTDILYLIISIIVLMTMKISNSKKDFIIVSGFNIGLFICIPIHGITRFLITSVIAIGLFIYIISYLTKSLNNNDSHLH